MSLNQHHIDRLTFVLAPGVLVAYGSWNIFGNHHLVERARARAMQLADADGEDGVVERYGTSNHYAQGTSVWAQAFNNLQRSRQLIFDTFPVALSSALAGSFHVPLMTLMVAVGYCHCSQAFFDGLVDPRRLVEADDTDRRNLLLFRQGIYLGLGWLTILGLYSTISFVFDHDLFEFMLDVNVVSSAAEAIVEWFLPSRGQVRTHHESTHASSGFGTPKWWR